MTNTSEKTPPLFWFYILVAYVFLQFIWWGFLMIELNNEIVHLKSEINLLKGENQSEIISQGNILNMKLHHRWLMISGEGVVFIGLLALGVFQVRKTFKKEDELARQQKNFLLSVTHELKSPIASSKLQLQTLQKHELDRNQQKEIIANTIKDTERLNNLVENILTAAKIDNKIYTLQKEKCNLSEHIENIIKQTTSSFNYKQNFILKIEQNIYFNIDKTAFTSILLNLIENAIKYSSSKSAVTISLKRENQKLMLSVIDEGIGITNDDKKLIFEKFYRTGNEETRNTKGTGLGLYIVNYLVKQHNGTIFVKNNLPKGSVFEAVFSI